MAGQDKINSITDIVNPDEIQDTILKGENVYDQNIVINGFDSRTGDKGDWVIMDVTIEASQETVKVGNSGWKVMRTLALVKERKGFPVRCKLVKDGKTWILSSPDTSADDPF